LTHLVEGNKVHAKDKDDPDEDVTKDTGDGIAGVVDHHGAVPEECNDGPGERTRDDGRMDEASVGVVAVVQRGEVEEVDDDHDLSPNEVGTNKEHNEGEVEKVVEDEVAADAGGRVDKIGVLGEEGGNVAALEYPENDPNVRGGVSVPEREAM
jgi:hypothetical protein